MSERTIGPVFRHKTSGDLYEVTGHAMLEADGETVLTLYRLVSYPLAPLWARPSTEFTERFEKVERGTLNAAPEDKP